MSFFETQESRAARAFDHGSERQTKSERLTRQIARVSRLDTRGIADAQQSKARTVAALERARADLQRAERMPPSAAAVSRAKHRTAARGQWVTASADFSSISMRYLRAVWPARWHEGIESEMVPIAEHADRRLAGTHGPIS